jgi:DNA-binding transcriptional ArsR family regulator
MQSDILIEYLNNYSDTKIKQRKYIMISTQDHPLPHDLPSDQAELLAQLFAALGDPTRARIIFALTHGEYSVNALAEMAGVSASVVSHHLARLRGIRLVRARRRGNQVFYCVDDAHVSGLYQEALNHLQHVRTSLSFQGGELEAESTEYLENIESA